MPIKRGEVFWGKDHILVCWIVTEEVDFLKIRENNLTRIEEHRSLLKFYESFSKSDRRFLIKPFIQRMTITISYHLSACSVAK